MFAYAVLAVWPIVTATLFLMLPKHRALIWSIIAAYLLLPVRTSFELPVIPSLDKTSIPNLAVLFCCMFLVREKWTRISQEPLILALCAVFILSPFATALFNPEPLTYADRYIPAMSIYDATAQAALNSMTLIPFIVAYGLLNTEERRRSLVAILLVAALAYSVLMLIEVRFSPQLHRMIYGFFPHSFGQQMRAGGFRPVVFLGHGLLVAVFCAMAITAAVAQWRSSRGKQRTRAGMIAIYLWIVLLLCKTLGATLLASIFVPITAWLRPRRQALVCAALCGLVLLYPAARAAGLIPSATISDLAAAFSADRAGSYGVRLTNEDQLVERAAAKPMFGWGSWGRNRLYSPEDGRDLSITDGTWIIVFGTWGWIGYLSMFGLLCGGSIRLLWKKRARASISLPSAALCTILAINLIDSVPNASITPLTWLIAGAVLAIGGKNKVRAPEREQIEAASLPSTASMRPA